MAAALTSCLRALPASEFTRMSPEDLQSLSYAPVADG